MASKPHARLSCSASSRWIKCPASIRECEDVGKSPSSEAALRGSAIHDTAERILKSEHVETQNLDVLDAAKEFAEYVRLQNFEKQWIETQVHVSGDCWGTADVIGVKDDELYVIDLKSGAYPVFAEENPQLMIYAIGALKKFYPDRIFKNIHLIIFQPAIQNFDQFTISQQELLQWKSATLMPAIKETYAEQPKYSVGVQCRFCDARKVCLYRNSEAHRTAQALYAAYREQKSTDQIKLIDTIMEHHDDLTKFLKDVKEQAHHLLSTGTRLESVYLVPGRKMRAIDDEQAFVKEMVEQGHDIEDLMHLKTVAQLEKVVSKEVLQFYTREFNAADTVKKRRNQ